MRVVISHDKTQQQVKDAVDRGMDQVFTGLAGGAVELTDRHKEWKENSMTFSLTAGMGFIRMPIKGSVEVGENDLTVDVDLGLVGKFMPDEMVRTRIESQVKGLLA